MNTRQAGNIRWYGTLVSTITLLIGCVIKSEFLMLVSFLIMSVCILYVLSVISVQLQELIDKE